MCPGGSRSREAEARPVSPGGFRLRRPRLWGLTFIPAELASSFCPRFTRKRRPLVCSALSRWLSWTPAWQPHPGLTQVGLGTGPPCLPCLGPVIAPVSRSPAPHGCWMWPRTPDGMSRAGPQPPCLIPPSSSDPAFRPPCVQWPEQATHLCLAAHVSQCNPPPHDPQSLPSAAGSLASSGLPATQPSTAPSLPARGSPGCTSLSLSPQTVPRSGPGLAGPVQAAPTKATLAMACTPDSRPPQRPSPTLVTLFVPRPRAGRWRQQACGRAGASAQSALWPPRGRAAARGTHLSRCSLQAHRPDCGRRCL